MIHSLVHAPDKNKSQRTRIMYQLTAAAVRVSLATLPAVTLFVISRSAQCAIMSLEIIYIALYIHLHCEWLSLFYFWYTPAVRPQPLALGGHGCVLFRWLFSALVRPAASSQSLLGARLHFSNAVFGSRRKTAAKWLRPRERPSCSAAKGEEPRAMILWWLMHN